MRNEADESSRINGSDRDDEEGTGDGRVVRDELRGRESHGRRVGDEEVC